MGIDPNAAEHSAFLGAAVEEEAPTEETIESPETPEPSGEAEVESTDEAPPQEEAEVGESAEEELQVVLPKEQAKQYSQALMNHYVKRLGGTPEDLAGNLPLQKATKQLIDGEIYAAKLKAELEAKSKPEEKKEEEKQENQPPADLETHFKTVAERATRVTSPEVLDYAVKQLESAKDTKGQLTVLTTLLENYLETVLPEKFQSVMTSKFGGLVKQNDYIASYEAHKAAYDKQKDDSLPEFGTPEYVQTVNAVKAVVPTLESDKFTPEESMSTLISVAKALAKGNKAEAEKVVEAAEKGKEQGLKAGKQAELGKGLGAGKSKGTIAPAKEGSGTYFGEGHALYRERETNNF